MKDAFYLTLSCDNRPGSVAAVAACLYEAGGNILEAQQFDDLAASRFFMRVALDVARGAATVDTLRERFAPIGARYGMQWKLRSRETRQRVLLLVSRFDHCLGDLLYRLRIGELPMAVVGIVSNHPKEALNLTLIGDIPYHYLPVTPQTRPQQEAQIKAIVASTRADLIVLARAVLYHLEDRVLVNSSRTVVFRD